MVQANLGTHYDAVRKRLKRLPTLTVPLLKAHALRDAKGIVKLFQDGIEANTLGLKKLKPATIKRKEALGQQLPDTPLYGEGLEDPRSLINCLEIVDKGHRSWVIRPRKGYHTQAASVGQKPVLLSVLFDVHEYGAVITNGFGRGIYIRIPPRPALRYAYRKYMAAKAKNDPSPQIGKAIVAAVQHGDQDAIARIAKKLERGGYKA